MRQRERTRWKNRVSCLSLCLSPMEKNPARERIRNPHSTRPPITRTLLLLSAIGSDVHMTSAIRGRGYVKFNKSKGGEGESKKFCGCYMCMSPKRIKPSFPCVGSVTSASLVQLVGLNFFSTRPSRMRSSFLTINARCLKDMLETFF